MVESPGASKSGELTEEGEEVGPRRKTQSGSCRSGLSGSCCGLPQGILLPPTATGAEGAGTEALCPLLSPAHLLCISFAEAAVLRPEEAPQVQSIEIKLQGTKQRGDGGVRIWEQEGENSWHRV